MMIMITMLLHIKNDLLLGKTLFNDLFKSLEIIKKQFPKKRLVMVKIINYNALYAFHVCLFFAFLSLDIKII